VKMKLKFGRLWFFVFTACLLGWAPMVFSGQNAPSAPAAETEKQVTYVLSVNGAPNDVKAFGFDLIYPVKAMKFEKADKGDLAKAGFTMFGANELAAGKIRIGGVATGKDYMKKGAAGELAVLTFKAVGDTTPVVFDMVDIKDDMKGWSFSGKTEVPLDAARTLDIRKKAVSFKP